MSDVNRQWVLASRPTGMVQESDFELRESPLPALQDGQARVRTLYLSFDPAMRGWLNDVPSYVPPVQIGEVMRAGGVGQVVESREPKLEPGDIVQGTFGWQEYALATAGGPAGARPVPEGVPITWPLGVLGGTGLTAYFGLLEVGQPKPGETVVVSAAAGATGSVAAQIARIRGCRVIGIAGSPDKVGWLVHEARLDGAIDYNHEHVSARLDDLCPDGIDVYFDNVGGKILDTVLARINSHARIALCGGISTYNSTERAGPRNYMQLVVRSARMQGFLTFDFLPRFGEAIADLSAWVQAGEIAHQEDIQHGFENAPATLLRLFQGKNLGKQLLRVADPEG